MQERDRRMFGSVVRESSYRGPDKSFLSKAEITAAQPVDHGIKPLIGKFSQFNLSYLTPEQRKMFVEQIKFEMSLTSRELNEYLSTRYTEEDMQEIWEMQRLAKQKPKAKGRKKRISMKAKKPVTPEEMATRMAKAKATRERNKSNNNYASYATIQREFLRRQKLLAKRKEIQLKQAVEVYAEPFIQKKVRSITRKLERENQHLKEYIRQNGLPLPGTKAAKMRRERLRANHDL